MDVVETKEFVDKFVSTLEEVMEEEFEIQPETRKYDKHRIDVIIKRKDGGFYFLGSDIEKFQKVFNLFEMIHIHMHWSIESNDCEPSIVTNISVVNE